jgi:sugar phosphate isomerase/epimerase
MSDTAKTSRRGFLGAAAGTAAAAGALGPAAIGARAHGGGGGHGRGRGGDIPESRIGIQLFTVRDLLADNELDLPGTFEMLSDAGYALVEVGGTYDGRTAAEFKALADEFGLRPEGSHVPGGVTSWRTDRATIFADAQALGLKYVGLASPPSVQSGFARTHANYASLAAEFNVWGAEAREHGLKFYFHNHPDDFTLDGGTPVYDTLLAETDPRLVYFELDIAWIEAGGQSAFEYLKEHGWWRFPLFHVKDFTLTEPALPPGVTQAAPRTTPANVNLPNRPYWLTDVGKGDIDFAKIFSALRDPDDHVYHVEHDDAPDDETASVPPGTPLSPRPRNPAGSANTSWVSRKYLAELEIPRRRH